MLPPVLTEAQARQAVNLPPPGGTPDAYTDRVLRAVATITELFDPLVGSTDSEGVDRWPATTDLPALISTAAELTFAGNWSVDVGAHSQQFGPDRYEPVGLMVGPAWYLPRRAHELLNLYSLGSFA